MPKVRPKPEAKPAKSGDPKSWRDVFDIDELAELFPPMGAEEFKALKAKIEAEGLHEKITLYRNKKSPFGLSLIEGRHRLQALEELEKQGGLKDGTIITHNGHPRTDKYFQYLPPGVDPKAYAFSKNLVRRHLNAKQKRELCTKLLQMDPSQSDREIARLLSMSPTTVGNTRGEGEEAGDVSKLDTRTDSAGRKQPARKAQRGIGPSWLMGALQKTGADPTADKLPEPEIVPDAAVSAIMTEPEESAEPIEDLSLEEMEKDPAGYWQDIIDERCHPHDVLRQARDALNSGVLADVVTAWGRLSKAATEVVDIATRALAAPAVTTAPGADVETPSAAEPAAKRG